jgi:hypothetical protein
MRFVDDHQPGWIEYEFHDAAGARHMLLDKVPIFTVEDLDATSAYPRPCEVHCEVLGRWQDTLGRDLIRIALGDGVTSTAGISEFVVYATQMSSSHSLPPC